MLSRKVLETIRTGGPSTVTLLEIDRGKVRLGVEAARDVAIWRGELLAAEAVLPPHVSSYSTGLAEGRRLCLELLEREAVRAGLAEQWAVLRRAVDGEQGIPQSPPAE